MATYNLVQAEGAWRGSQLVAGLDALGAALNSSDIASSAATFFAQGKVWTQGGAAVWHRRVQTTTSPTGTQAIAYSVDTATGVVRTAVSPDATNYILSDNTGTSVFTNSTLRFKVTDSSATLHAPLHFDDSVDYMGLPVGTADDLADAPSTVAAAVAIVSGRPKLRVGTVTKDLSFTDDPTSGFDISGASDYSGSGVEHDVLTISANGDKVPLKITKNNIQDGVLPTTLGSLNNTTDRVDGANDFTILIRGAGGNGKWGAGTMYGTGGVVVTPTASSITIDGSGITGGGGGGGLTAAQVREQVVQMSTGTAGVTVTAGGTGASRTIAIALSLASGANPGGIKSGGDLALAGGTATLVDDAVTLAKIAATGTDGQVPTISGSGDSRVIIWKTPAGGGGGATTLSGLTDVSTTAPANHQLLGYTTLGGANQWAPLFIQSTNVVDGSLLGGDLNVASVVGSLKASDDDIRAATTDSKLTTVADVLKLLEQTAAGGETWDLTYVTNGGADGASLSEGQISQEPGHEWQYNIKASDADENEMDDRFHRGAPIRIQRDASNYVDGYIQWADHDPANNIFSFAIRDDGRTSAGDIRTNNASVDVTAEGANRQLLRKYGFATLSDLLAGDGLLKSSVDSNGRVTFSVHFADRDEAEAGASDELAVSPEMLHAVIEHLVHVANYISFVHTTQTLPASMPSGSWWINSTGTQGRWRAHSAAEYAVMKKQFLVDKYFIMRNSAGQRIEAEFSSVTHDDVALVVQCNIGKHAATPASPTLSGDWTIDLLPEQNLAIFKNVPKGAIEALGVNFGSANSGKHVRVAADGSPDYVDAPSGGGNYTLPVAGAALGGIKNDGDLAIDADGTPTLKDNVVDAAALANGVVPERDQFTSGKMDRHRGSSDNPIIGNSSTRFSDTPSGGQRLWAIPASGQGSFTKMTNGSLVTGAQQYNCMRANSGGLYNVRIDGIGIFYCRAVNNNTGDSGSAERRQFGAEVGLQFAWKLPTSNTWSSWLDCYSNADHTATVNGSSQTIYDISAYAGTSTRRESIECDNASANQRFRSFFKTKFFAYNNTSDTYYPDVEPPFWLSFGIGTNQLFPVTGLDYRFRCVFAAANASVNNVQAEIRTFYNYSEELLARRLN